MIGVEFGFALPGGGRGGGGGGSRSSRGGGGGRRRSEEGGEIPGTLEALFVAGDFDRGAH